jgi:hypothetical protein
MNTVPFAIILYALFVALIAALLSFVVSFLLFRKKRFSFRRMMIAALSGECLGFVVLLFLTGWIMHKYPTAGVPDMYMGFPVYGMLAGVVAGIIWISRDRTGYWQ